MHLRQAHGGQARALIEYSSQDLPERELAGEILTERFIYTAAASHFIDRPDGAPGEGLAQFDMVERAQRGEIAFKLEGQLDSGNLFGIAMGEVGNVAFANPGAFAEGLAEVDRLIGFAVRGGPKSAGHVHVHILRHIHRLCKYNNAICQTLCMSTKEE